MKKTYKKRYAPKRRYAKVTRRVSGPKPEWKSIEVAGISQAVNTSGYLANLIDISQGTAIGQRVGNKVTIRSIECQGYVEADASATVAQMTRIMFVWDYAPNGTAAALNNILQTANVNSERNLDFRERFKILKDMHIPIAPVSQDGSMKNVNYYRKLYKEVSFTGAGGTTINKGMLYLCLVGSVITGTADAQFRATIRIRYTDV